MSKKKMHKAKRLCDAETLYAHKAKGLCHAGRTRLEGDCAKKVRTTLRTTLRTTPAHNPGAQPPDRYCRETVLHTQAWGIGFRLDFYRTSIGLL